MRRNKRKKGALTMAFITNALNFPNLTTKSSPTTSDLVMIADAAASNALKQCTIAQLLAAASSGGLTLIASVTASNSATVNFDNKLSATYDNYLVTMENLIVSGLSGSSYQAQVGTGAGPSYQATNYTGSNTRGCATSTSTTAAGTTVAQLTQGALVSNIANRSGSGWLLLSNVNNSSNDKTIISHLNTWDSSGLTDASHTSAVRWKGATVLTSILFSNNLNNIATGTFKLYGYSN